MDWNALVPSIIGGLIAGGFAILAVILTNKWNRDSETKKEKKEIVALIQSIKDEIETLSDLYMDGVGTQMDAHDPNMPFLGLWFVTQDYFTIYQKNASKIGMIENDELRKSIIRTYSIGRSTIDTYNLNNSLINKYHQNMWYYNTTFKASFLMAANQNTEDLKLYADSLKKRHLSLKAAFNELKELLRLNLRNY